ncbi:hypothetical protein SADUNF_Sadunf16G0104300 [Salix dunnii]|uniref:Uncharacterized protein n=1 Tax=Salix dunnii TaxID=1413687 RepID=A0A835J8Z9_9ROSI|nr:hypothetical protein SADUNF_Sadunf16G0104300 [Salix dunnii]
MGDSSGKIDVEKLISFSDDLIAVLKDQRDINNLTHCLQQSHSLKSSCDAEFNDSKTLIEVINNEISDLECQRVSFEERKRHMKKDEKDELRAQRMLSMYASVTNVIPDLDDHSKISGRILYIAIDSHGFPFFFFFNNYYVQCYLLIMDGWLSLILVIDIVHRDNKAVGKFEFDPTKIRGGLLLLNVFGFRPFICDGALVRHCILVFESTYGVPSASLEN